MAVTILVRLDCDTDECQSWLVVKAAVYGTQIEGDTVEFDYGSAKMGPFQVDPCPDRVIICRDCILKSLA